MIRMLSKQLSKKLSTKEQFYMLAPITQAFIVIIIFQMPRSSVSHSASPPRPSRNIGATSPRNSPSPARSPPRETEPPAEQPKIHISGLSSEVTKDDLNEAFSKFGGIQDCFIPNGKPFGFVRFDDHESVRNAIDEMNNTELKGSIIRVSQAKPRNQSRGKGCFKCGEEGHMARDCSNQDNNGPRGQSKGGRGCFKCGEEGHMARDCPNQDNSGPRGQSKGGKGCFNCGETGHFARQCPNPKKEGGPRDNRKREAADEGSPQRKPRKRSVSSSTSQPKRRNKRKGSSSGSSEVKKRKSKRRHDSNSSSKSVRRHSKRERSRSAELKRGRRRPVSPSSSGSR